MDRKRIVEMFNWQDFQNRLGIWADSVFGDRTGNSGGLTMHLIEEVVELHENPKDLLEYADCIMLIIDKARIEGFTMFDIEDACEKKLKINIKRKWGKVDENGLIKHIK